MPLLDTRHRRSARRASRAGLAAGLCAGLAAGLCAGLAVIPAAASAHARPAAGAAAAKGGNSVVAWGRNFFGQLGNGTTTDASKPVFALFPGPARFTTVRTGVTSIALTTTGRVYGWANNTYGQIGDGSTADHLKPVRATTLNGVKVTALRGGGSSTLALTSAGRVLAWGRNGDGELGDGTTTGRSAPVRVKIPHGVTVTAIATGFSSGLALTKSGRVLAWGLNDAGQLGDGTTKERHTPGYVRLPAHTKITSIAAGDQAGYAVTSSGRLLAWGNNQTGGLGDGTTKRRLKPVQVHLPKGVKVVAATAGTLHALALTTTGRVLAWGFDPFGQFGTAAASPAATNFRVPRWIRLPNGAKARALAAGADFAVALTTSGRVLAWGRNKYGQLGNGTTTSSISTPVRVHLPPGFKPTGIGAGWDAETALAIGNAPLSGPAAASAVAPLRSWGNNVDGELGRGNLDSASVPVKVKLPKGVTIRQVRAGCRDAVALSSAGHVYAWGANDRGQLGTGTTVTTTVPAKVKLPAGVKVTAVRAGCGDNLALTSAGRVYAWGANDLGELGDGTHRDRHRPVLVKLPKNTKVKSISAGCEHSLAITSAGKLLAWGDNAYGQLGNGNQASKDVPVRVKLAAGATASVAAAGCNHSLAMTSAGLYAWGLNHDGQLGIGSKTNVKLPHQIVILRRGPPIGKLTGLFGGCFHSLALFAKGAVLSWGDNTYGQLGNGSTTSTVKPVGVELPTGVKVTAISTGCHSSYALTSTGQVLSWGLNEEGQLGIGTSTGSDLPVLVHLPAGLAATAVFSGESANFAFALVRKS